MTDRIPCSVLILTRNSAGTLAQCLAPLAPFGEILIHDANSTDNTVEIAKKFGAKVMPQYPGDTTPSLRVKDFTEMRLRERTDAAYDWVFYLDSDEEVSPALVKEIGDILRTADPKTIIKLPRVPVIDGIPRIYGGLIPDVMPRIHHRKSGATLKSGKTVHEKYVYDRSFREIVTKNVLLVPLEPVSEMRAKDDRYITLEVERIRRDGMSWTNFCTWILLREPAIISMMILRILLKMPQHFDRQSIPFSHHWRYVRYHWRLFRAVTGVMLFG